MLFPARAFISIVFLSVTSWAQAPAPAPTAKPPAAPAPAAQPPATAPATGAKAAAPKPAKAVPKLVPKKPTRYTLEQISEALEKKMADRALSRDLKARGVAPEVNREAVERFKQQGAGPETVAILQSLIPHGSLTVQAEPGAAISLDGQAVGVADARGALKLDNLDAGPHEVKVTQAQRSDYSQAVTIKANGHETLVATLAWTTGYLTVDPKQPEAKIVVSGAGSHVGRVQKLPVSVGEHTIAVTLPLRKPFKTTVNVRGGEVLNVPVRLDLDANALKELGAAIDKSCAAKDYDGAEQQMREYQKFIKLDSDMLTCLSVGYLHKKQYDQFVKLAGQSLAEGGEFTFAVMHTHGPRRRGAHEALLTLRQNEVQYEPKGKCNLTKFSRLRKDATWVQQPQAGGGSELILTLPEASGKPLVMTFFTEDAEVLGVIYRLATQDGAPASNARVQ